MLGYCFGMNRQVLGGYFLKTIHFIITTNFNSFGKRFQKFYWWWGLAGNWNV
jgi:hypothetical protein